MRNSETDFVQRANLTLSARSLSFALGVFALLLLAPASASASKQAVDFIGGLGTLGGQFSRPLDVAVNDTGAGPASAGDVYVVDSKNFSFGTGNRVERFGRDTAGTPDTADDTYFFISAWGADVSSNPAGGDDYEICTVAADCKAGIASGGNGTPGGNGTMNFDTGTGEYGALAVDQDTGNVFVADVANFRVNVYDGTGVFLRSFGYDVVASGPDDTGTGYEICAAAADVCKAGSPGTGLGQVGAGPLGSAGAFAGSIAVSAPDGNPSTGTVFLADTANRRVDTYNLDGSGPSSIGSATQFAKGAPRFVVSDSRGILYATSEGDIERYDTIDANGGGVGFLAPILPGVNEKQTLTVSASAGTFNLTFDPDGAGPEPPETTVDLPYNASAQGGPNSVMSALRALPSLGENIGGVTGGPGDATGSNPYRITFQNVLGAKDVPQLVVANGATPLSGGSGASIATTVAGQPGLIGGVERGLAVDPDTDGAGPDTDVLFAARGTTIQQIGPVNSPGLTAPPVADDDRHGTNGAVDSPQALSVEPATGRLYAAGGGIAGLGVYVLDNASPTSPTATLDSCDNVTTTSVDCHATIDPNGPPATRYHFEYSTDGLNWHSLPEIFLGYQEDAQAIDEHVEPLPVGLDPNTEYHVRVVAGRKLDPPVISNELTFTTAPAPPLVETAGAPVRTTTTAQLNGRVTPLGSTTSYRFEYGTDQTYGQSTPPMPAGSGQITELVGEEIAELAPDTTYHYRLVAENGVGSPVMGADMSVHTRASNQLPGQSDTFPGPPGSDRAWEQVSIAESSGNPIWVLSTMAFSDDGNRAVYSIAGGTPISTTGSFESIYFAQRTPSGWQPAELLPPREQMTGQIWRRVYGTDDLSTIMSGNSSGTVSALEKTSLWRLSPEGAPSLLAELQRGSEEFGLSADGSLAAAPISEALDPNYPLAPGPGVYDVSASPPRLLSLMPDGQPAPCGVQTTHQVIEEERWISNDGSLVYFQARPATPCAGPSAPPFQLYVRDRTSGQTSLVSGPPLSGGDCGGTLIKAIPGAAFFETASRLAANDPAQCGDPNAYDVYRYDTGDGSLECVTCVIPGFSVGVKASPTGSTGLLSGPSEVAVAENGSRLYFNSDRHLLPGAPPAGQSAVYRVDVGTGALDYVAPLGSIGTSRSDVAMSSDGLTLAFSSNRADLNPLGGLSDNGGGTQYYRYDDRDRSLVCVSCPQDGSKPSAQALTTLQSAQSGADHLNNRALSKDGSTLAFLTPVALVGADQNTPRSGQSPSGGDDVYEWRDGRQVLVTDGLTDWHISPAMMGVSADGSDVYFTAAAALTPDAPDALIRLYDARIGGGFHFPKPPPPCPLEVCQGVPKGAPEEQEPASGNFSGPGNLSKTTARRCPKGKRKVSGGGKSRCVSKQHPRKHRRATSHNRRAAR
jgi:hypothetical protein